MTYQPNDTLLNKYRIESLLGQGAFGEVYLAKHLQLNVQRAIKVLRRDTPGLGSTEFSDFRARFQFEAQLGAKLDHPNIIRVHDFEQDGETLILVMEYAQGGSLAERLARAREIDQLIPIDAAVQVALEVAQGLSAIHTLDAVHRDIKPSNILFDKKGHAKVADMGLAQMPGGPSMRSQLSMVAPHPGTPGYKSPEQESISNYLTPASDVYALGLVLFEMLTGRVYHSQRPGTRAKKLRPHTPSWLDELLVRMLAEQPEDRPWNGEEVGEQLAVSQQRSAVAEVQARKEADEKARQEAKEKARKEAEEQAQQEAAAKAQREAEEKERREAEQKARRAAEARAQREKEERERRDLTLELAPGVTMEFVRIPAGEFLMGSDRKKDKSASYDEMPQHKVYLDEYLIGKHPVTNRQYQAYVQAAGVGAPPHWQSRNIPRGKENHPVVYVNWKEAAEFCEWASSFTGHTVRLPNEVEWEKAARGDLPSPEGRGAGGGEGRIYPWGNQPPDAKRCNFNRNVKDTTPVGKYSPSGDSPYGCADMAGNVWEWVADWYDSDYYVNSPAENPSGPSTGSSRVLRGGSWYGNGVSVRAANRFGDPPGFADGYIGFRCVRSAASP